MNRTGSKRGLVKVNQLLLEEQSNLSLLLKEHPPPVELQLSAPKRRLLEDIIAIKDEPDAYNRSYLARELVQCTLPHSDPGDVPAWERRNGYLNLGITPGWDFKLKTSIGFPYGTHPRLLLYWITTEAVQKGDRTLHLGASYSAFIRKLGLNDRTGGGARGTYQALRNQVRRLFAARISFQQSMRPSPNREGQRWLNMEVTKAGELWWDPRDPDALEHWEGYITLGDAFYDAITASPIPIDFRHLRALKKSPLTLDLYAWLTHKAFIAQSSGKNQFGPWGGLTEQFGADYKRPRAFRANALAALEKITSVYEGLKIELSPEGITILSASKPAIPTRVLTVGI